MTDDQNIHASAIELPEGAVVQNSVLIVAFFDADGQSRYGFRTQGQVSTAGLLGLMELAKFDLLTGNGDDE